MSRRRIVGFRSAKARPFAERKATLQASGRRKPADALLGHFQPSVFVVAAFLFGVLENHQPAGLIVVGSSHRGDIGRVLPGSTAVRLLQGGPSAVAVAPRGYAEGDGRFLVLGLAYDGSPEARAALGCAIELGERLEATMRVVTVDPPAPLTAGTPDERRDFYERQLAEAMEAIPKSIRPAGKLEHGDPIAVIVKEAERGIDLLLLGSRGYGPVRRVFAGAVSAGVLERAPCPVLVLPRPAGAGDEPG